MRHRGVLAIAIAILCGTGMRLQAADEVIQGKTYKFEKVAEGVYYASGGLGSNNVVIVNDRDVVLVDDGTAPAAARAFLEDIKLITNKPVTTVINTHFHYDHTDGNSVFPPDVQIIGHEYVRTAILTFNVLEREPFKTSSTRLPPEQLRDIKPTPPNVTYTSKMVLHKGGREIQLLFLGRGHTGGDTFVYLPKERIVCTGDMDEGARVAYMGDAFFDEWIASLDALKKLDFNLVLPGHGVPFRDKGLITAFQGYLKDLTTQVTALRSQGVGPDEAAKRVDMTAYAKDFPEIKGPGADLRGVRHMYEWMDEKRAAAPATAALPPLMDCGTHGGDVEILCGTHSPEDLEPTPDGKFLIVSQFVNGRGATGQPGLVLFDIGNKTFSKMTVQNEPRKDWGDPACPGPPGDALLPHGISLSKRAGPKATMQLYVVNHGGRQSMEMYELRRAAAGWELAWHGCFVSKQDYNDVAALADGGFIATQPTALRTAGDTSNLLGGQPTGYVVRWTPGTGQVELPGTRIGYPNGVLVSPDARYMYVNAWTAREVHKYDLKTGKETGVIKLDFMPDNITWTSDRRILAAGVAGTRGECPAGSGAPCIQGFGVAEIDPAKMEFHTVFDWRGKSSPISGVSSALKVGNSIYLGAFQGDRIVRLDSK